MSAQLRAAQVHYDNASEPEDELPDGYMERAQADYYDLIVERAWDLCLADRRRMANEAADARDGVDA